MLLFIFYPSDNFLEVIKKSNETPVKKFEFPQTSAQEIGWNTEPLVGVSHFLPLLLNYISQPIINNSNNNDDDNDDNDDDDNDDDDYKCHIKNLMARVN